MSQQIVSGLQPQLDWLRASGVQVSDGPDEGGVFAWVDAQGTDGSFLYSEITGYFMTLATHLSRVAPEDDWVARAERAAGWIVNVAMLDDGAMLTRKYPDANRGSDDPFSFDRGLSIFFDCAMVGFGLVNTYEASGNKEWLTAATRLADFCLEAFESSDESTRYAAYDTRKREPLPAADRWSHHFGSFELKSAMFFDSLASQTGNDAYSRFVERILPTALVDQHPSGRFGTNLTGEMTHLHPHNYTIEALLYLAGRQGRSDLLEHAKRAIDFAFAKCLNRDGKIVQAWSEKQDLVIPELRSDVLAQSLRSYQTAKLLDPAASWAWEERVPELEALLDSFSMPNGGTSYGQDEYGAKSSHANAWCHFFNTEMRLLKLTREHGAAWDPRQIVLT